MKKTKYFAWMVAAGLALTGCSDELEGGGTPVINEGATGYAKVSINLPTTVGTRAANDNFDDGLESEYDVKEGVIIYFAGESEATANFVGAYSLPLTGSETWDDVSDSSTNPSNGDGPVTSEYEIIAQAPLLNDGSNLYALVVLNPNKVVTANNSTHALTAPVSWSVGTTNQTLSGLQAKLTNQNISAYITDGFLMANAPLASKTVTSTDKTAIVSIMPTVTVYETEADAQNNGATTIHVERAMAKVTLGGFTANPENETQLIKNVTDADGDEIENNYVILTGWTLDVTNKSTKLVHDVTGAVSDGTNGWFDLYATTTPAQVNNRFVSAYFPYRLYWAVDGNYDGTGYGTADPNHNTTNDMHWIQEFNYIDDTFEDWTTSVGENAPLYCFENTFDQDNMDRDQSTRIVIKGQYVLDGTAGEGADFFVVEVGSATYKTSDFVSQINSKTTEGFLATDWECSAEPGEYKSVDGLATLLGKNATSDKDNLEKILEAFGSIKYYENGQTYYEVRRIQHFGDELTPLRDTDTPYQYEAAQHLGRYGVVRNNWYDIQIASISGPGEPTVPPTPEDPDDEESGYIKATIRILSWAKRTQNVDL